MVDHLIGVDDDLSRFRIGDLIHRDAAQNPVVQRLDALFAVGHIAYPYARDLLAQVMEAILLADDDVLRHVDQTPGQVTRVRRTQSGIGQALAGTVGGDEELQH